jgi:hypothetical protein
MTRQLAGAVLLSLIAACGGSDPKPPGSVPIPPGAFVGNFLATGQYCNGGTPLPSYLTENVAPYSTGLVSADGHTVNSTFMDGTCTVSSPFNATYEGASTMTLSGSGGAITCAPSAAACASLLAHFGLSCGSLNSDAASTWSFTTVPTVVGGSLTLTAIGGPNAYTNACSNEGLTGPLTLTYTKQ